MFSSVRPNNDDEVAINSSSHIKIFIRQTIKKLEKTDIGASLHWQEIPNQLRLTTYNCDQKSWRVEARAAQLGKDKITNTKKKDNFMKNIMTT